MIVEWIAPVAETGSRAGSPGRRSPSRPWATEPERRRLGDARGSRALVRNRAEQDEEEHEAVQAGLVRVVKLDHNVRDRCSPGGFAVRCAARSGTMITL